LVFKQDSLLLELAAKFPRRLTFLPLCTPHHGLAVEAQARGDGGMMALLTLSCAGAQKVTAHPPPPLPPLPSKAARSLPCYSRSSSPCPTRPFIGNFVFRFALQHPEWWGVPWVWPALPSAGASGVYCLWQHVSSLAWCGWAGLTAEIGSWLLFDRYIIPAALHLFTKQCAEHQKLPEGGRNLKPRGPCKGSGSLCELSSAYMGEGTRSQAGKGAGTPKSLTQVPQCGSELSGSFLQAPAGGASLASWTQGQGFSVKV
jgi:hypothetical protein